MKKLVFFISLFLLIATQADAQSWLDKVGKKVENAAKRTVERKAEQKTEDAVGKAVDKAIDKDTYKESEKDKDVETIEWTEMESGEIEKSAGSKQGGAPKLEAYSKYDFVPGDQILFYEDFSQDAIGDFPALWTTNVSGEVKTINIAPGKWLQNTTSSGEFAYLKNLDLPANFILEFDYIPYFSEEAQQKNPNRSNWYATGAVKLYSDKPGKEKEFDGGLFPGDMGLRIHFRKDWWSMDAYDYNTEYRSMDAKSERNCVVSEQVNHIIVWVQNRRVRVYHGGAKVMDVPTMLAPDTKLTRLRLDNAHEDNRPFFSNIKITTASPDTRSKLITEGKLITYGITFDVNKDVVKPESYGTLKSIADVLAENPDVKVKIIGHTDSDGADDANLDLSRRRAASVKSELSKSFGIDASRMETEGAGESQPIAPNDTSENKAKNRRVEFVKQ
ncbi:OmpA family protein [Proteiniphilum acetatigenes]|uniref:OmpA family protein n=1 Tax=Proteiniphilum acetatigenes TaxID=294710 RepID=UPI000379D48D|nr:OmpA family protein [Proteiniphilum acetatigenes]SFK63568.1 Outer membrane protein OmpA [Porphyromonadaceae bacterium KH3CP3RA]